MTREEKIEAIIDNLMDNWGNARDFDNFVKEMLRDGFCGYAKLSDEEINQEYSGVFEEEEEE